MKCIQAIIKPFKLEEVKDALGDVGIEGMTVSEVKGYDPGHTEVGIYCDSESDLDYPPKIGIMIVVPDASVAIAIAAIIKAAKTGKPGDGKIFVSNILEVIRIRTEERAEQAIS